MPDGVVSAELELRCEPDEIVWSSTGGYVGPALRVQYRSAGDRRWRSFLLCPTDGQALNELEQLARPAAIAHRATIGDRR